MLPIRGLVIALTLFVTGCAPIYRNHGYFPPEAADALIADCARAQVTVPGQILRRFAERYG